MVNHRVGAAALLVVLLSATPFTGQDRARRTGEQSFVIRRGQSVYIAAYHRVHDVAPHHTTAADHYLMRNDLEFEAHIRSEFQKQKAFRVADKLSDAEFVFMVYREDHAAEAYVLAPDKYLELSALLEQSAQGGFDLHSLREAAYGRYLSGHVRLPTHGRMSGRLVKEFHKTVGTR